MGIEKKIDVNSFPKQYSVEESQMGGIGRKVEVCFFYKAENTIPGVIIRDDRVFDSIDGKLFSRK